MKWTHQALTLLDKEQGQEFQRLIGDWNSWNESHDSDIGNGVNYRRHWQKGISPGMSDKFWRLKSEVEDRTVTVQRIRNDRLSKQ